MSFDLVPHGRFTGFNLTFGVLIDIEFIHNELLFWRHYSFIGLKLHLRVLICLLRLNVDIHYFEIELILLWLAEETFHLLGMSWILVTLVLWNQYEALLILLLKCDWNVRFMILFSLRLRSTNLWWTSVCVEIVIHWWDGILPRWVKVIHDWESAFTSLPIVHWLDVIWDGFHLFTKARCCIFIMARWILLFLLETAYTALDLSRFTYFLNPGIEVFLACSLQLQINLREIGLLISGLAVFIVIVNCTVSLLHRQVRLN